MHNDAWQESHLGDWIKLLSGGTPPKSDASLWGGSIPWISCKDMKVSLLDSSQDWLTEAGASKLRKVPSGTILIVVRGMILANEFPVARCLRDVTFNQDLKAVIPREGLDEGFLFQWLRGNSYEILGRVDEAGHGTKRLQTDRLLSVPLRLPPLPTQRRIASILSAYDDLIENNTKRIEILEEMARSLYREWFVHFRFPGHEKVKLVDSELGKIPEGWEVTVVSGWGPVITGKTPPKKEPELFGSEMPFLKLPDMHGQVFAIRTEEGLSSAGAATQRNKTVPANAICVSCIGTAGIVNITSEPTQTNQQINTLIPSWHFAREYLFFFFKDQKEQLEQLGSNGATMTNVNKGKFGGMKLVSPAQKLLKEYHARSAPMLDLVCALQKKNEVLRQTRDLLLPKLISGEIDVDALDLPEELPRSGPRRRKGRDKIDGDALALQETA